MTPQSMDSPTLYNRFVSRRRAGVFGRILETFGKCAPVLTFSYLRVLNYCLD
jgi:hypothetical protein